MNLIKIGQYIAGKRKDLGLTQRELAEKLGMSDKSVSKWERGVCLPDVSLYEELCETLGIGLNEFLAGEDISEEKIIPQSEENILVVATDSKIKQKKLKRTVTALCIFLALAIAAIGIILLCSHQSHNYITPADSESVATQIARTVGGGTPYVFDFVTDDAYKSIDLNCTVYHAGAKIYEGSQNFGLFGNISESGSIMIIPTMDLENAENSIIKFAVSASGTSGVTNVPYYPMWEFLGDFVGNLPVQVSKMPITFDEEQGLFAISYTSTEIEREYTLAEAMDGSTDLFPGNSYTYVFSYRFNK